MSVDSNVFVIAVKSDAMQIGQTVYNTIQRWQREQLDQHAESLGMTRLEFLFDKKENTTVDGRPKWSNGAQLHASSFDCFQIVFTLSGEERTLWYFVDCSSDTDEITKEHTLIFSLGHWGSSERIMQVIIQALKPFGPVYYDHNDCDDEDYVLQS